MQKKKFGIGSLDLEGLKKRLEALAECNPGTMATLWLEPLALLVQPMMFGFNPFQKV